MTARYCVYSADKAGNLQDWGVYDEPRIALALRGAIQETYGGPRSGFATGIRDNESPELGDVAERLEQGR